MGNEAAGFAVVPPVQGRKKSLAFPDVVPWGRGAAEKTLAIANATGGVLKPEASQGLQTLADAAEFHSREFLGIGDFPTRIYAVRTEGWNLKVPLPSERTTEGEEEVPRADSADVTLTLSDDGSVFGMARFEVEPRLRPFLPVDLPPDARPSGPPWMRSLPLR